MAGPNPPIVNWLLQKRLTRKAGPSTPLFLKGYALGRDIIEDSSVREALV